MVDFNSFSGLNMCKVLSSLKSSSLSRFHGESFGAKLGGTLLAEAQNGVPVSIVYLESNGEFRTLQCMSVQVGWNFASDIIYYNKETFVGFKSIKAITIKDVVDEERLSDLQYNVERFEEFKTNNPLIFENGHFFLVLPSSGVTQFSYNGNAIPLRVKNLTSLEVSETCDIKTMMNDILWNKYCWENNTEFEVTILHPTSPKVTKLFLERCFEQKLTSLILEEGVDEQLIDFLFENLGCAKYLKHFTIRQDFKDIELTKLIDRVKHNSSIVTGQICSLNMPSEELMKSLESEYNYFRYYRPFISLEFEDTEQEKHISFQTNYYLTFSQG